MCRNPATTAPLTTLATIRTDDHEAEDGECGEVGQVGVRHPGQVLLDAEVRLRGEQRLRRQAGRSLGQRRPSWLSVAERVNR